MMNDRHCSVYFTSGFYLRLGGGVIKEEEGQVVSHLPPLHWIGLDWIGLDWNGMKWIGLAG